MRYSFVIPPDPLPECKVVIARVDSDGCTAEPVLDVHYGTHAECCQYMRTHKVRTRKIDPNKYEFAIVYVKSGHYASYVL